MLLRAFVQVEISFLSLFKSRPPPAFRVLPRAEVACGYNHNSKSSLLYLRSHGTRRLGVCFLSATSRKDELSETVPYSDKHTTTPASQWMALAQVPPSNASYAAGNTSDKLISTFLVCGDGDLSYSASVAPDLASAGIRLTATVLESQQSHTEVYRNSKKYVDKIKAHGHDVRFGIDATKLTEYEFPADGFDRIQFNFPHWRGKSNARYNRLLLSEFLLSASKLFADSYGEIHVALCEGQGGSSASSLEEWRRSWLAAQYGAESGLLLADVSSFEATYDRSSHRGVDRAFRVGEKPELYKFVSSIGSLGSVQVPKYLQMCCRHELHVKIPISNGGPSLGIDVSVDELLHGDLVSKIIKRILPDGIRVEVPLRDLLKGSETGYEFDIVVFLVVYCGERTPITRAEADRYRFQTEEEVSNILELRQNRVGRLVSRPFPYRVLPGLIDQVHSEKQ